MNNFWECINGKDTFEIKELVEEYENKILIITIKIKEYFEYHSPLNFITDTCYGIDFNPISILEYIDSLVMSGKDVYESFLNNPFDGTIENKLYTESISDRYHIVKFKKLPVVSFDELFSVNTGYLSSKIYDIFVSKFV